MSIRTDWPFAFWIWRNAREDETCQLSIWVRHGEFKCKCFNVL